MLVISFLTQADTEVFFFSLYLAYLCLVFHIDEVMYVLGLASV